MFNIYIKILLKAGAAVYMYSVHTYTIGQKLGIFRFCYWENFVADTMGMPLAC